MDKNFVKSFIFLGMFFILLQKNITSGGGIVSGENITIENTLESSGVFPRNQTSVSGN